MEYRKEHDSRGNGIEAGLQEARTYSLKDIDLQEPGYDIQDRA